MRENNKQRPLLRAEADGIIEGRNAVIEALRSGENIDKIYLAKGETDKTLGHIASRAREKGIVVVEADRRKLDFMSQTHAHQGVIAGRRAGILPDQRHSGPGGAAAGAALRHRLR